MRHLVTQNQLDLLLRPAAGLVSKRHKTVEGVVYAISA